MSSIEGKLRTKLTDEEFELAMKIVALPPSKIRGFIEEIVQKVFIRED